MSDLCQICRAPGNGWRCPEHNRCDVCGSRVDLVHGERLECGECRARRVAEEIASFDGDTSYQDEITCPHCGVVGDDSGEGEYDCWNCELPFFVSIHVETTYSTSKGNP